MSYLVISHDTYGTWCHDISRCTLRYHTHQITSKHQAQKLIRIHRKPTTSLRSALVCFSDFVSALVLGVFVWPFLSFFCYPSARNIIGLTIPPASSNLVPSGLGLLLSARMLVFSSFFFFPPHYGLCLSFLSQEFSFFFPRRLAASNCWLRMKTCNRYISCLLYTSDAADE